MICYNPIEFSVSELSFQSSNSRLYLVSTLRLKCRVRGHDDTEPDLTFSSDVNRRDKEKVGKREEDVGRKSNDPGEGTTSGLFVLLPVFVRTMRVRQYSTGR